MVTIVGNIKPEDDYTTHWVLKTISTSPFISISLTEKVTAADLFVSVTGLTRDMRK